MTTLIILTFVSFALLAFGLWVSSNAKTGPQSTMGNALIMAGVVAALILLALAIPVHARDDGRYAQSPLKPWFDSLKSGKGPCCSDADGTALSDVDWEATKDGHYRVRIEDKWWPVPDEAIVTEPNRVGRTMVWPIIYRNGAVLDRVDIRCFMPGPMI
jgi:hypothetical protein